MIPLVPRNAINLAKQNMHAISIAAPRCVSGAHVFVPYHTSLTHSRIYESNKCAMFLCCCCILTPAVRRTTHTQDCNIHTHSLTSKKLQQLRMLFSRTCFRHLFVRFSQGSHVCVSRPCCSAQMRVQVKYTPR